MLDDWMTVTAAADAEGTWFEVDVGIGSSAKCTGCGAWTKNEFVVFINVVSVDLVLIFEIDDESVPIDSFVAWPIITENKII